MCYNQFDKPEIDKVAITVREIKENELNELLQLYLFLHEEIVPEMTEHLKNT